MQGDQAASQAPPSGLMHVQKKEACSSFFESARKQIKQGGDRIGIIFHGTTLTRTKFICFPLK